MAQDQASVILGIGENLTRVSLETTSFIHFAHQAVK